MRRTFTIGMFAAALAALAGLVAYAAGMPFTHAIGAIGLSLPVVFAISADSSQALASIIGGANAAALDGVLTIIAGDGAASLVAGAVYQLTKGSAAAVSVAAPGAGMIGKTMTFVTGSDFAHVVTFTGTTLQDGTTGLNSTWTAAAFAGSSLTVIAVSATRWAVVSFNLGTIAP